jgi:hypothetical protein
MTNDDEFAFAFFTLLYDVCGITSIITCHWWRNYIEIRSCILPADYIILLHFYITFRWIISAWQILEQFLQKTVHATADAACLLFLCAAGTECCRMRPPSINNVGMLLNGYARSSPLPRLQTDSYRTSQGHTVVAQSHPSVIVEPHQSTRVHSTIRPRPAIQV